MIQERTEADRRRVRNRIGERRLYGRELTRAERNNLPGMSALNGHDALGDRLEDIGKAKHSCR